MKKIPVAPLQCADERKGHSIDKNYRLQNLRANSASVCMVSGYSNLHLFFRCILKYFHPVPVVRYQQYADGDQQRAKSLKSNWIGMNQKRKLDRDN